MARIILIETSTALCSVALAKDGRIVAYKESETPRAQASLTAPFVKDILDAQGLGVRDCDAVCVSKGPGSYTGLRVGVSTAKGLCFGAGIPLIAVGTLDTLVYQAADEGLLPEGCRYVVPMVDARRMEVYTAVFTPDGRQLTDTRPQVIESLNQAVGAENHATSIPTAGTHAVASASFADLLAEGPVLFIGDGAGKCREALSHPNAYFVQCCPKTSAMLRPAFSAWDARRFEDTAYFEPFYLKEFIATVPRKKLF
jgi:tRNA threonylcarbamoyladenosine biosynthesis protein TsaB